MTLALQLGFRVIAVTVLIIGRLVGFANLLDLAEAVDGFEATLGVSQTNRLREGSVALEEAMRVSTEIEKRTRPTWAA